MKNITKRDFLKTTGDISLSGSFPLSGSVQLGPSLKASQKPSLVFVFNSQKSGNNLHAQGRSFPKSGIKNLIVSELIS